MKRNALADSRSIDYTRQCSLPKVVRFNETLVPYISVRVTRFRDFCVEHKCEHGATDVNGGCGMLTSVNHHHLYYMIVEKSSIRQTMILKTEAFLDLRTCQEGNKPIDGAGQLVNRVLTRHLLMLKELDEKIEISLSALTRRRQLLQLIDKPEPRAISNRIDGLVFKVKQLLPAKNLTSNSNPLHDNYENLFQQMHSVDKFNKFGLAKPMNQEKVSRHSIRFF